MIPILCNGLGIGYKSVGVQHVAPLPLPPIVSIHKEKLRMSYQQPVYQQQYAYPPQQPPRRAARWGFMTCCIGWLLACGGTFTLCIGAFVAMGVYLRANAPEPPLGDSFTPNAVEANQVATMVINTINVAEQGRGEFNLTITQEQASSWMVLNLEDYQSADGMQLSNPQVSFQNGQAQLYTTISVPTWGDTGVLIDLFYTLTPEGKIQVGVGEVNFGGVGLPDGFVQDISTSLQTEIDRELSELNPNYHISSMSLQNGQLTISGRVTP